MRTNKELLELILEELRKPSAYTAGICWVKHCLLRTDKITGSEYSNLTVLLRQNKPFISDNRFWWPAMYMGNGEVKHKKVRIKFLEKLIKKYNGT